MIEASTHQGQNDTQRQSETEVREKLNIFTEALYACDGRLIALDKKVHDHYLAITSRKTPITESNRLHSLGGHTAITIDVYASKDTETWGPVGYRDWWLDAQGAQGGGYVHHVFVPQNERERLAENAWTPTVATKVAPEFRKQKIGSLMMAASFAVLAHENAPLLRSGILLDPAVAMYKQIGNTEQVTGHQFEGNTRRLANSLWTKRMLAAFVCDK